MIDGLEYIMLDEKVCCSMKPKSNSELIKTGLAKYPVIDAHIHFGGRYRSEQYWEKYDLDDVIEQLRNLRVSHVVNLELFTKKHWDFAWERTEQYRDFVSICAPINFDSINEDNFEEIVRNEMRYYHAKGACGFKVWKNLGLSIRKKDDILYSLNDDKLSFIWNEVGLLGLPIVIHVGDPPSFWDPVNEQNPRYIELKANPKWSYCDLDVKYEDLLEQLETLLRDNPDTTFVVAHMCASAHDLDYVSKMLSIYHNLYVDIAAVLSEIGLQPEKFKNIANKYSDRIIFGTDYFAGDIPSHLQYYRFLETCDEDFSYTSDKICTQGNWNITGCKLSEDVLKKIYFTNAQKVFKI